VARALIPNALVPRQGYNLCPVHRVLAMSGRRAALISERILSRWGCMRPLVRQGGGTGKNTSLASLSERMKSRMVGPGERF
jgi:hypothetical protein